MFPHESCAQTVSIRTNALYWLTSTPNAGIEAKVSGRGTLGLSFGYNPFIFPDRQNSDTVRNPQLMHWVILPEYKYWFCRSYERWYISVYGMYGRYNIGGISLPGMDWLADSRYEGMAAGGGVGIGYQWAIGRSWGVETSLCAGYLFLKYGEYGCGPCGDMEKYAGRHYIGPTRTAVSFIYYIR